jgi:hypothetical protein
MAGIFYRGRFGAPGPSARACSHPSRIRAAAIASIAGHRANQRLQARDPFAKRWMARYRFHD